MPSDIGMTPAESTSGLVGFFLRTLEEPEEVQLYLFSLSNDVSEIFENHFNVLKGRSTTLIYTHIDSAGFSTEPHFISEIYSEILKTVSAPTI